MVRLLLAIRAGADPIGEQRRSDNCSSLATANAIGSGYQRTGVNRAEGANDHDRVVPLGDMSPKGTAIAPTPVGNRAEDYHERKIQGRAVSARRLLCSASRTVSHHQGAKGTKLHPVTMIPVSDRYHAPAIKSQRPAQR